MSSTRLTTEDDRQRLVNFALGLTENTSQAPTPYERQLLDSFVRGHLTIDHVLACLEAQEYKDSESQKADA